MEWILFLAIGAGSFFLLFKSAYDVARFFFGDALLYNKRSQGKKDLYVSEAEGSTGQLEGEEEKTTHLAVSICSLEPPRYCHPKSVD
jgi:hypothetical protein